MAVFSMVLPGGASGNTCFQILWGRFWAFRLPDGVLGYDVEKWSLGAIWISENRLFGERANARRRLSHPLSQPDFA